MILYFLKNNTKFNSTKIELERALVVISIENDALLKFDVKLDKIPYKIDNSIKNGSEIIV